MTAVNQELAKAIIDILTLTLEDRFEFCREREMTRLHLEELRYRFWHHSLGPCPCTDIDFVEYRWNPNIADYEIIGLVEIKTNYSQVQGNRITKQRTIQQRVANRIDVPLWQVTFEPTFHTFTVQRLDIESNPISVDHEQYREFIQNLEPMSYRMKLHNLMEAPIE